MCLGIDYSHDFLSPAVCALFKKTSNSHVAIYYYYWVVLLAFTL